MSPMIEKDELKEYFLQFLGYYYDLSQLQDTFSEQVEETVLT